MILAVNHIALSVPEHERALAFYEGVLGFRKVEQMAWAAVTKMSATAGEIIGVRGTSARAVHLQGPNLLIELFEFSDCKPRAQDPQRPLVDHGITHFCLAVQDLDAEYARLAAAGVRFLSEPVTIAPGLRTVYGRDPFGNVIEFEEAKGRRDPSQSAPRAVRARLIRIGLEVLAVVLIAGLASWQFWR